MNNKVRFTKIRNVKSPSRNQGDAGSDFYVPEYSEEFIKDLKEKYLLRCYYYVKSAVHASTYTKSNFICHKL